MKIYEVLKEAHQIGLIQAEKVPINDLETEFPEGIPDNYFTSKSGSCYRADMKDLDMYDLSFKTHVTRYLRLIAGCSVLLVIILVILLILNIAPFF